MPHPHEEQPARVSRIRGGLPGDEWRKYVSEGAKRAYDNPLAPQRQEAKALRHKGRLVAAHRKEKASYRIRVRGYDRKRRGEPMLSKAFTIDTHKIGPYTNRKIKLRLTKQTRWEKANDTIKAVGSGLGGVRTVAALGGGAAITAAVKDKTDKAKTYVTGRKPDTESKIVKKSLTIDDINGRYQPVTKFRLDIDTINKADVEYWDYIEKTILGPLGQLGERYGRAAYHGFRQGGISGAGITTAKVAQRTGGWKGAEEAARNTWSSGGTGTKAALGGAAGLAGAGALGYGAWRGLAKPALKKRAKKYALYGAAGIGGTAAAGSYLGSSLGNR